MKFHIEAQNGHVNGKHINGFQGTAISKPKYEPWCWNQNALLKL